MPKQIWNWRFIIQSSGRNWWRNIRISSFNKMQGLFILRNYQESLCPLKLR